MATKQSYIQKATARLNQWDAQIASEAAKLNEAEADTKIAYQAKLDEMCAKRDSAKAKLDEARAVSEETWREVEGSAVEAWATIEDGFHKAAQKLH